MFTRRRLIAMGGAALAFAGLPLTVAAASRELRAAVSEEQLAAAKPEIIQSPPVTTVPARNFRVICHGLRLPEGPIALSDGSVLVVEVEGQTLSRCTMDGKVEVIARVGGGPNGAALGPDGACYIANNGGFEWAATPSGLKPPKALGDYQGGSIQRVNLDSGEVEVLYESIDGRRLSSPNDLVFDGHGGFWFTDWGKPRNRSDDKGSLYYAKADGSMIREVVFPLDHPNGIALSPDGGILYVSESHAGRLLAATILAPGEIGSNSDRSVTGMPPLQLLAAPGGNTGFDSMKVEAGGSICVATVGKGGITRISPDGGTIEHTPLDDFLTTNLAFGGGDLKTCFVTLSGRGQLAAIDWPAPGLPLHYSQQQG